MNPEHLHTSQFHFRSSDKQDFFNFLMKTKLAIVQNPVCQQYKQPLRPLKFHLNSDEFVYQDINAKIYGTVNSGEDEDKTIKNSLTRLKNIRKSYLGENRNTQAGVNWSEFNLKCQQTKTKTALKTAPSKTTTIGQYLDYIKVLNQPPAPIKFNTLVQQQQNENKGNFYKENRHLSLERLSQIYQAKRRTTIQALNQKILNRIQASQIESKIKNVVNNYKYLEDFGFSNNKINEIVRTRCADKEELRTIFMFRKRLPGRIDQFCYCYRQSEDQLNHKIKSLLITKKERGIEILLKEIEDFCNRICDDLIEKAKLKISDVQKSIQQRSEEITLKNRGIDQHHDILAEANNEFKIKVNNVIENVKNSEQRYGPYKLISKINRQVYDYLLDSSNRKLEIKM